MEGNKSSQSTPPRGTPVSARGSAPARLAIVLVVAGVLAMVLPGLLRDGICGLIECADVTPEVAVGRPGGHALAVVVPEAAAGELRSLRLFPITENAAQDTAGAWIVYRDDPEATPATIELGTQPEGFKTRIDLAEAPSEGLWVLDASFGCASTLVRFAPEELDPGFVTTGDAPVPIGEFQADARATLRCATDAPGWQRGLFIAGVLSASIGAILGMWVLMRRPVADHPEWYAPDDTAD